MPSLTEWTAIEDYIADDGQPKTEGTALKSKSGWDSSVNGTDNYGFTTLPGDQRSTGAGLFYSVGR